MLSRIKRWYRDDLRYAVNHLCDYMVKNTNYCHTSADKAYSRFMFEGEYDVTICVSKNSFVVEVRDREEKRLFNIHPTALEYDDKRYFKEFVKFLDKLEEGV